MHAMAGSGYSAIAPKKISRVMPSSVNLPEINKSVAFNPTEPSKLTFTNQLLPTSSNIWLVLISCN